MKKLFFILLILISLALTTSCYPTPEEMHSAFSARLATAQASPIKEYTFIVDGHEKKVCGNFMYIDSSILGTTYYVGWGDGSLIGQFSVPPTTAFPKPDCKN